MGFTAGAADRACRIAKAFMTFCLTKRDIKGRKRVIDSLFFPRILFICILLSLSFVSQMLLSLVKKMKNKKFNKRISNYIMYISKPAYTLYCATRIFYHVTITCQYIWKNFLNKIMTNIGLCNNSQKKTKKSRHSAGPYCLLVFTFSHIYHAHITTLA